MGDLDQARTKQVLPNFLPTPLTLPNGLVARIELVPMPRPDKRGRYGLCSVDTGILVTFFRGGTVVERRDWKTVICGAPVVALCDGTRLEEADLYDLDSRGWALLSDYGLVQTSNC